MYEFKTHMHIATKHKSITDRGMLCEMKRYRQIVVLNKVWTVWGLRARTHRIPIRKICLHMESKK
jgi:hypothetical protein